MIVSQTSSKHYTQVRIVIPIMFNNKYRNNYPAITYILVCIFASVIIVGHYQFSRIDNALYSPIRFMLKIVRTTSDNPDFQKLTQQLDITLCEIYGTKQEDYAEYNRIEDLHTVVLAYQDDEPAGCGCFKKFNEDTIEIKRMFVTPVHRGKGIASRILYELETWAIELKYTYSALETGNGQSEAIDLYQKCGYTITTNYGQYANEERSVCMLKALWTD
jgi:putative acetyltransferase